jgi:L-amino acid N-acyltransferase YncA
MLADGEFVIAFATRDDIPGILELQEPNLPERGGTLSVRMPFQWFEAALGDMPVTVARKAGRVVGYLVSSSITAQRHVPIVQAMLRAYPGSPDAYTYGPVCVAASERGRGLPAKLFAAQRAHVGNRECITFIRRDNAVSLRAHAKLGMREVAEFEHGGVALVVVAYSD